MTSLVISYMFCAMYRNVQKAYGCLSPRNKTQESILCGNPCSPVFDLDDGGFLDCEGPIR